MADVLAEFRDVLVADGVRYHARACGAPMEDSKWQGWLEFLPLDGGPPVRSARETTQPNRTDAAYWATGLTAVYLEGALQRALNPPVAHRVVSDRPAFDGPAEAPHHDVPVSPAAQDAVLDPFAVYEKEGEALLRRQLAALAAWHLVNIVEKYELSDEPVATLNHLPAAVLIDLIVSSVRSARVD